MPRRFVASTALAVVIALGVVPGSAQVAGAQQGADDDEESSLVGVHDNNIAAQVCHNQLPVNVLGIMVPIKEIAASIGVPVLSEDSPARGPDSSCNQDQTGRENSGNAGRDSGGHSSDAGAGQRTDDKPDRGNDDKKDDRSGPLDLLP